MWLKLTTGYKFCQSFDWCHGINKIEQILIGLSKSAAERCRGRVGVVGCVRSGDG